MVHLLAPFLLNVLTVSDNAFGSMIVLDEVAYLFSRHLGLYSSQVPFSVYSIDGHW